MEKYCLDQNIFIYNFIQNSFLQKWSKDSELTSLLLLILMKTVGFIVVIGILIFIYTLMFKILLKFFPVDKNGGINVFVYVVPFDIIVIPIMMLGDCVKYEHISSVWWYYPLMVLGFNIIIFLIFFLLIKKK